MDKKKLYLQTNGIVVSPVQIVHYISDVSVYVGTH